MISRTDPHDPIYLLEPFLYISFTTELEGEKISCLRNYHQNIDQQDMFNDAMARNLNKVHEVLGKKYSEDMKDEEEQTEETAVPNSNEEDISDEGYGLNYFFDFDESYKKHILTRVKQYLSLRSFKRTGNPTAFRGAGSRNQK